MSFISLSQAFAQWQELAAGLPQDDAPMLAESWNDYTDSLCKDGQICALQYHYAPAYDEDMPGEGSRFDELSDDRAFILDAMGIAMSAHFVPFSQSRNKSEKNPSLNWKVVLKKGDREITTTDYMQGCNHAPAYNAPITFFNGKRDEYSTRKAIAAECETGKRARTLSTGSPIFTGGDKIEAPDVVDVLHCLLSDSEVINYRGFEDWADDIGFDSDSIKARDTYNACLEAALKLRAALGESTLRDLRELFEGMR